ncbi:metal ABC transporter ATP-binding protein [Tepidibacter hydrothermalis]|uniref:ABC transporter ATP-binding protein n=1 Tax=Tepidibacter hydrothermalis TaxID=3036126 RepID=A0ABY8EJ24_9FIRM|nr:ABC transporter ATP-binding protein [Tepidibacter hydrothermalis]WFD10980.1 ABC transporter ATP-binding protein [Tepidibacter hydrothermalis]
MNDIEMKNLSVKYGTVCALKDINLNIGSKEFVGITGPNGAGKSTLLKVLLGIIKPTSGSIILKDNVSIGYVPQFTSFDKQFPIKVLDVILMGNLSSKIKLFKKYSKKDIDRARNIMDKLGIKMFEHRQIGQLSGGQLQKVLIGRALMTDPEILVLDEPTASLDFKAKIDIYEMLSKIKKEKTIIIVTHDMEEVVSYTDRVVYLNKGLAKCKEGEHDRNII